MKASVSYPHLKQMSLLRDLPDTCRSSFLDSCQWSHHAKPADLLAQGEPATGLYIVAQGGVEIYHTDADGNLTLIHIAGPGEILGEVEALAEKPCAASCRTLADTTVLFASKAMLVERAGDPMFLRNVATQFYERLRRDNNRRASTTYRNVEERLRHYLAQICPRSQPETRLSQSHLAALVGSSRETVNRRLKDLREAGLIELGQGRIRVLDHDRLESGLDLGS